MNMVHIYSLDSLASYGTQNLLKKKYLNKLILQYMDSNFLSTESSLIKLLPSRMWKGRYACGINPELH